MSLSEIKNIIYDVSKIINVKTFGNIFYLNVKFDYKMLGLFLLPFLLQFTLEMILSEKQLSEFSLKGIAFSVLTFSIIFIFNKYKDISYFIKIYSKNRFMFLIIGLQSCISLYLYLALNQFIIYAILGAFFWFSSGILRGIIQYSDALFKEESYKLVELIQIYSFLRFSYFFLFVILLMDVFEFRLFIGYLFNLNHQDISIELLTSLCRLFISMFIFLFCITNLYPYLIKSPEVETSIQLVQFISSSRKGYRLNKISSKFYKIKDDALYKYLANLNYNNYIKKENNRYKLTPHYNILLNP